MSVGLLKSDIRLAEVADATTLSRLASKTFLDTFAPDNEPENMRLYLASAFAPEIQAREIMDSQRRTLIAWHNAEAIGYAQLRIGPPEPCVRGPKPIELLRLYVLSEWHGKKIADQLMSESIALAYQLGFHTLWLGVWEKNPRAQKFYRKWNFLEVGDHIFQMGHDPQRDIIMSRSLPL